MFVKNAKKILISVASIRKSHWRLRHMDGQTHQHGLSGDLIGLRCRHVMPLLVASNAPDNYRDQFTPLAVIYLCVQTTMTMVDYYLGVQEEITIV